MSSRNKSSASTSSASPCDSTKAESVSPVPSLHTKPPLPELSQYRSARPLPYELQEHCAIYLEEHLYANAFTLLNNLVAAGTSFPTPAQPAYVPTPEFPALASTLLIHPAHTTRPSSDERRDVSSHALVYLRNLLAIVGPVNAGFDQAFTFLERRRPRQKRKSRSHGRRTRENSSESSEDEEEEERVINSSVADEGSVWRKADDFWQIVGWTFNCSVTYQSRWEYWKVWLQYMLDVIDADWKERDRLGGEELQRSILCKYMSGHGRNSIMKRAVKSIFADGSPESRRLYPEVFENETKERNPGPTGVKTSGTKLDIDNYNFGDYVGTDDYDGNTSFSTINSTPGTEEETIAASQPTGQSAYDLVTVMGGSDAMTLRLRLMAMLSRACATFPDTVGDCTSLYGLFYDHIRPLPLRTFSLFLSPSALPHLPAIALSSLAQLHLSRLLQTTIPPPSTPDDSLTQATLETSFLPFAANTSSPEDNAKASLLLECLFRLFALNCPVDPSPKLEAALEKGIAAREARSKKDRRKKPGSLKSLAEDEERAWLDASSKRLRATLKAVQRKALREKEAVLGA